MHVYISTYLYVYSPCMISQAPYMSIHASHLIMYSPHVIIYDPDVIIHDLIWTIYEHAWNIHDHKIFGLHIFDIFGSYVIMYGLYKTSYGLLFDASRGGVSRGRSPASKLREASGAPGPQHLLGILRLRIYVAN